MSLSLRVWAIADCSCESLFQRRARGFEEEGLEEVSVPGNDFPKVSHEEHLNRSLLFSTHCSFLEVDFCNHVSHCVQHQRWKGD